MKNGKRLAWLAALWLAFSLPAAAQAPAYPQRPVKIVIGFGPGTAIDTVGRMFAEDLAAATGQPVIVDNKPGANSAIAAEFVARAPADGYTLLLASNTSHAANPSLMKKLGYDPIADFAPVGRVGSIPFVLVTGPNARFKTVDELTAFGRDHPNKLSYASSNSGSLVAGALLAQAAQIQMSHVPYKGSPQALTDVIAGHVDILFVDPLASRPHLAAGKLAAIGVTSRTPIAQLPHVPSIVSALGQTTIVAWYAMFAPRGTPPAIVNVVHTALDKFLGKAATAEKLALLGVTPWPAPPAELGRFVASETAAWRSVIERAGIQPE